ncbi:MAG: hypothetical protein Q9163_005028 [Psora crenata]
MRMAGPKNHINLLKGHPNPYLLPVEQIKAASLNALSKPDILTAQSGLEYGPDPGYLPLRKHVAEWLTQFYRPLNPIGLDRICITGGASQNLACILQVFSDPVYTRNVWLVSPTYFEASRIFEDGGFEGRLRAVPEDEEGLDMAYLERGLQESEEEAKRAHNVRPKFKPDRLWRKIYRHLIYAVPTFANPTTMTMSLRRRQQLVRIARRYDGLIITDDVYDQLLWPTDHCVPQSAIQQAILPRVVDVDRGLDGGADREGADGFGNAVSNASFSKIVGPGARTGWAEGAAKFAWGLSQCGSSKSGGAPSHLVATFMASMLESGDLQRHVFGTLQPAYARRYRSMMAGIEQHLIPLGVTLPGGRRDVVGGYFIWLLLPHPLHAEDVVRAAKEDEDLDVAAGAISAVWGDERAVDLDRNVRLSFAWEEEDQLAEGVLRLSRVVHKMLKHEAE